MALASTSEVHAQGNLITNPSFDDGLTGWIVGGDCIAYTGYVDMYWNCMLRQDIAVDAGKLYLYTAKIYSAGDGEDWESMRIRITNCDPNRTEDFFVSNGWNELQVSIRPATDQICRFQLQQRATYPAQFVDEISLVPVLPPPTLPTPTPTPLPTNSEEVVEIARAQLYTTIFLVVFLVGFATLAIMRQIR